MMNGGAVHYRNFPEFCGRTGWVEDWRRAPWVRVVRQMNVPGIKRISSSLAEAPRLFALGISG